MGVNFLPYTSPMFQQYRLGTLSTVLFVAIVVVWFLSGRYLGLGWFASQNSSLLLQIGAVDGAALSRGEFWRLIASQFLHVHFLHMLFNACAIFVLAHAVERGVGKTALVCTYFIGGTIGQYFSVLFQPGLVSSGASQALMALCGFAVVCARRCGFPPFVFVGTLAIVGVQAGLDIAVSGSIKAGHGFGFVAGALIGIFCIAFMYIRVRNTP